MKNPQAGRPPVISLITFAFLLTSICSAAPASETVASSAQAKRIAEHPEAFAALPADTRQQLAEGRISQGQNMKLVYLALGRPDHIVTTPDAKTITWTYRNYLSPVIATNKTVIGRETKQNFANGSPLQDTMDAWNNGMEKHEIPVTGTASSRWEPKVTPKAPNQTWAEYAKYRNNLEMARRGLDQPDAAIKAVMQNMSKNAELEYREALTLPLISSPDPVKLDVIFVDQLVSDAIVDESFSAFSAHALPLTATAAPGVQSQIPE